MSSKIESIKGTRDYYPEEMAVRTFIYKNARKVSESFGYEEIDGPFLESIDLYAAKSGEELVKEQSFVFEDRGGGLIALRPELTPSIARMVAQRQNQLVYPLRWWSWGPFWRYERPQKGRTREFFQWNIDLIGVDSPEADAEMVAIAANFLIELGLSADQVKVFVNNRQLMDLELQSLDIPGDLRLKVFRLIDRRDKLSPDNWISYGKDLGLTTNQITGLENILNDLNLWHKSKDLIRLFQVVDSLGVSEYVKFAPHIIRGLDYYTGTVFEVWDQDGEFRAILGGGRYDSLVEAVGGKPLPAVGFAMGDLIISLVLKKFDRLSASDNQSAAPILVTLFDQSTTSESFRVAATLRRAGFNVICYPIEDKLGKQFRFGDRMGIKLSLILGPDEIKNKQVSIKDLNTGEQITIPESDVIKFVSEKLKGGTEILDHGFSS
jgi:histidyl-tRNA synthetase